MSLAGSVCYSSSLSALPQCWLSQATCTAFCAERDGNATGGCGVTTSLCAPSDAAAVNASNAALALVADAGGAFTCLQPPPVYSSDNLGWSVIPLIVGFMCGLFVLLFFLPSVLFQCNVLWPARFPLLSDFGATSIWTSRARESGRAASHDALRGGSGRLGPPAQLSWADSARLDKTRLRDEQEAAASRAANGKARLVDLALLGQWEELEVRILDRGSDTDAGAGAFGWLPLHHAARLGVPLKTLSLLLEAYPGAVNACTFDAVHGFSPVARATELQLLLLLALSAAAACVLPIAIAVCLTRTFVLLGKLGLCFGVGSVVFALVFFCLFVYFPVPFYSRAVEVGCILTHRDDFEEASMAGRAAARLHGAMAALNACMPDRLKGRVWVHPSPARTPLGVASDELQRALLTHSPTAAALAEVVRALAWAAPHTLLRTSMVNTDFGRALLRDVVLSDSALLWRPYRDTASGGRTLTQLALAAREEAMRDGGGEPKSGAPDVGVLFTLLDAHMLFGLQPPPELLEALPKSMPGYYACFCELARFRYWGYEEEIKAAVRERETTVDPAYAHECKPVLFAAVGRQPVRLGQGGFAQVLLYRRQSLSADDAESTPAGAVAWEQPFTPGVAVKIYTPAATKELDAQATEALDTERTVPAGNGAAGAPKAGARIAALLNETLLLRMMDHPHVVRFLDAKAVGDRLELYMQLAPGGDLDAAFAKAAQHVRWRAQGARLAREVASGLRYLHDKHKQAHRDLKPKNVLLSAPLPAGAVLLADFGISVDALRRRVPDGMRTELWAAPETDPSRGGKKYDLYRADIHSFGRIMRKLITGTSVISIDGLSDLECSTCKEKLRCKAVAAAALALAPATAAEDESAPLATLLNDSGAIGVEMCCKCPAAKCSLASAALACAATLKDPDARPSLATLCARLEACEPLAAGHEADTEACGGRLAPHVSGGSDTLLLDPGLEQVTVEC